MKWRSGSTWWLSAKRSLRLFKRSLWLQLKGCGRPERGTLEYQECCVLIGHSDVNSANAHTLVEACSNDVRMDPIYAANGKKQCRKKNECVSVERIEIKFCYKSDTIKLWTRNWMKQIGLRKKKFESRGQFEFWSTDSKVTGSGVETSLVNCTAFFSPFFFLFRSTWIRENESDSMHEFEIDIRCFRSHPLSWPLFEKWFAIMHSTFERQKVKTQFPVAALRTVYARLVRTTCSNGEPLSPYSRLKLIGQRVVWAWMTITMNCDSIWIDLDWSCPTLKWVVRSVGSCKEKQKKKRKKKRNLTTRCDEVNQSKSNLNSSELEIFLMKQTNF